MTKLDLVKNVLAQFGGIAKTSDFVAAGVTKQELGEFCKAGELERIRQGYYQLAGNFSISEAQYLRALLPEGIVCVESALFYYGYSDFAPRVWTLAVPRSISLAKLKIDVVPIKAYYIQNNLHEIGKTFAPFDGTDLAIYDRDRTICDCFKYRTKLDSETFSKAIKGYVADDEKNLGMPAKKCLRQNPIFLGNHSRRIVRCCLKDLFCELYRHQSMKIRTTSS